MLFSSVDRTEYHKPQLSQKKGQWLSQAGAGAWHQGGISAPVFCMQPSYHCRKHDKGHPREHSDPSFLLLQNWHWWFCHWSWQKPLIPYCQDSADYLKLGCWWYLLGRSIPQSSEGLGLWEMRGGCWLWETQVWKSSWLISGLENMETRQLVCVFWYPNYSAFRRRGVTTVYIIRSGDCL